MVLRQVPKFFTKHETINYLFSKVEQIVADSDNQNEVESTILDFFHERFTDQSKCASLWQRDTPYKLLYPLLKNLADYYMGSPFPEITKDFTMGYNQGGRIILRRTTLTLADKIGDILF